MIEINKKIEWKCTCQSCGKIYCTEHLNIKNKCPECGSGNVKTEENIYYVNEKGDIITKEKAEEILNTINDKKNQLSKWKKDIFLGISLIIIGLPMLVVKFGILFILLGIFFAIGGLCEKISVKDK